jgi:hypothetical protein
MSDLSLFNNSQDRITTFRLTRTKLGRIWEVIIRNYYVNQGYAVFRCSGSGPPCDLIAFFPTETFSKIPFPIRPITRSDGIELHTRQEFIEKRNYQPGIFPRVFNGLYLLNNEMAALQVHLIAFAKDHMRLIWVRPKTKKKSKRIWSRILRPIKDYNTLTFIECKASKVPSIDSKQHLLQLDYAKNANAFYYTVQKTNEGALLKWHDPEKGRTPSQTETWRYIVKWRHLLLGR